MSNDVIVTPPHLRFAFLLLIATLTVRGGDAIDLSAQTQSWASFEVASVKESPMAVQERRNVTMRLFAGGRYEATNVSVQLLIMRAYAVENFQISGGPDWKRTVRYDIFAKVPETTGPAPIREMLRNLLAERFGLVTRKEPKELSTYSLIWANNSKTLGPGIRRVTAECEAVLYESSRRLAGIEPSKPEGAQVPAPKGCKDEISMGPGKATLRGMELSALVFSLTQEAGRPVIDKTGLKGRYDIDLEWASDSFARSTDTGVGRGSRPSIFTAVRERLGLTLESEKGLVDTLVIERLERPTPD